MAECRASGIDGARSCKVFAETGSMRLRWCSSRPLFYFLVCLMLLFCAILVTVILFYFFKPDAFIAIAIPVMQCYLVLPTYLHAQPDRHDFGMKLLTSCVAFQSLAFFILSFRLAEYVLLGTLRMGVRCRMIQIIILFFGTAGCRNPAFKVRGCVYAGRASASRFSKAVSDRVVYQYCHM